LRRRGESGIKANVRFLFYLFTFFSICTLYDNLLMNFFHDRFVEYLQESDKKLNDLKSYEQLNQRASGNGFKIEAIIYNGYTSSVQLQTIQDTAIQSRTQLRLNAEIEKQKSELIDLKLQNQNKCVGLESELNRNKCSFDQVIADENKKFHLSNQKLKHDMEMKIQDIKLKADNEYKSEKNRIEEEYLLSLSELNIDLNRYKNEMTKNANRVDRLYHVS
jgi:hypothetical protein